MWEPTPIDEKILKRWQSYGISLPPTQYRWTNATLTPLKVLDGKLMIQFGEYAGVPVYSTSLRTNIEVPEDGTYDLKTTLHFRDADQIYTSFEAKIQELESRKASASTERPSSELGNLRSDAETLQDQLRTAWANLEHLTSPEGRFWIGTVPDRFPHHTAHSIRTRPLEQHEQELIKPTLTAILQALPDLPQPFMKKEAYINLLQEGFKP